MLNNTYDALGYRYGILATNKEDIQEIISENANNEKMDWIRLIQTMANNGDLIIVDFEDVDGLTLKEFKEYKMFNNDLLLFVMYDKACTRDESQNHKDEFCIRHTLIQSLDLFSDNMNIDDVITTALLHLYNTQDELTKRRTKCFLERYKYGTKEATNNAISKRMVKENEKHFT